MRDVWTACDRYFLAITWARMAPADLRQAAEKTVHDARLSLNYLMEQYGLK